MQTTFYTFTANEIIVTGAEVEQVSGDNARRMVYLRHSKPEPEAAEGGKLIDFCAWCAEHEEPDAAPAAAEKRFAAAARWMEKLRGWDLDRILSVALIAVSLFACINIVF